MVCRAGKAQTRLRLVIVSIILMRMKELDCSLNESGGAMNSGHDFCGKSPLK
jgi:hypothetical protein